MKTKLLHVSSTSTANRADGSAKRPYATLEAARDALRRTHLACELNPFSDSSCYARVRVAP